MQRFKQDHVYEVQTFAALKAAHFLSSWNVPTAAANKASPEETGHGCGSSFVEYGNHVSIECRNARGRAPREGTALATHDRVTCTTLP